MQRKENLTVAQYCSDCTTKPNVSLTENYFQMNSSASTNDTALWKFRLSIDTKKNLPLGRQKEEAAACLYSSSETGIVTTVRLYWAQDSIIEHHWEVSGPQRFNYVPGSHTLRQGPLLILNFNRLLGQDWLTSILLILMIFCKVRLWRLYISDEGHGKWPWPNLKHCYCSLRLCQFVSRYLDCGYYIVDATLWIIHCGKYIDGENVLT